MNKKTLALVIAWGGLTIATSTVARADNLLFNGGFENPAPTQTGAYWYDVLGDSYGWSTTGANNHVELWANGFIYEPAEGKQFAELNADSVSTLSQQISGGSTSGGTFTWGFSHRARTAGSHDEMEFVIFDLQTNTPLVDYTVNDDSAQWHNYSGVFTMNSSDRLDVRLISRNYESGGVSYGNLVDNVYVTSSTPRLESTRSTPEPATMLLFGTGLVGLSGLARRKNK